MGLVPPRALSEHVPANQHNRLLRRVADAFLTLLAPESCRLCDGPLLYAATHPVCPSCLASMLPLHSLSCCFTCGEPLEPDAFVATGAAAPRQCFPCSTHPPRFVRATSYALYQDVREAVHLFKFEGLVQLAEPLGRMLAAAILQHAGGASSELTVVPLPLFRGKRSFNQSTLLASEALRFLRRKRPDWNLQLDTSVLRRTRRTESQFLLSRTQRRDNLRGAFHADERVRGRDVLLIDDVYTTGTTARECTRTLLAAGARSVRVATLARAGRDTAVLWRPDSVQAREAG